MSRVKLDKDKILKKFKSLSMTAMSIQKTSKYMYQFFKSSDSIVSLWHQALYSASDQSKISLFYIANEMLQSRNYGSSNFKQSWKSQLPQSVDLIKNSSINDKIIRMFNIWIERHVYDQSFIEELISKISITRSPVNDEEAKIIILNFEPDDAIEKLKTLIKIESEVTETMKHIDITALNFDEKSCKEAIKKLKDKAHCNEFTAQLDSTINQLFRISTLMEEELKIRKSTLKIMENAEIYYQTQLSETLIVEDAYKRYGNLISKTKDALEEHLDFLMDDVGPIDIDDAPSPGKTPPYLYEEPVKKISELKTDSPMSFQDVSPTQSMDMSEDDTPMESSTYLDNKPYSPSNEIDIKLDSNAISKTSSDESVPSLSCSDALKILTSVFTQSLAKKITPEPEARVHLQPDIFRNTLSSASTTTNEQIENNSTSKSENSDSVVADAFRLISNLTGIKNISERSYKSETTTASSGTTIPILTSKSSFRNISNEPEKVKPNIFPFNQSNYPNINVSSNCDTVSHTLFPDVQKSFSNIFNQHSVNNNQIFPLLGTHSGLAAQQPPIFNPMSNNHLSFNLNIMNKDNQNDKKSPGSCTEDEDEGGATPTQDEPVIHQNTSNIFNQNVMPVLHPNAEEINKQLQNVMNASGNPFGMPNMLANSTEPTANPPLQQQQWSLPNQFPFNMNNPNVQPTMNMPFNLINQNPPIQPSFSPVNSAAKPLLNFGPPRAIRTKRPNPDSSSGQVNNNEMYGGGSSMEFNLTPPPPPPPKPSEKDTSTTVQADEQPAKQSDSTTKATDKESELLNLYGDVEEEIDRNCNFSQQNINVRNTRPPPPSDRYHLYNQATPPIMGFRFPDHPHANILNNSNNTNTNNSMSNSGHGSLSAITSNMNTNNRMGYPHSPFNFRNQFPRAGPTMYFPNRTTNFRPRNNYNMFN